MSTLFTPEKTLGTLVQGWKTLATANADISSSISVSGKWGIRFDWEVGRQNGTAFTTNWPALRVQTLRYASGDWEDLIPYSMAVGASVASTTLNGALTAGGTTAVVTSATNFVVDDWVFIADSSTANYEIAQILSISGTTLTFYEAYAFNHANSAIITSQALKYTTRFSCELDTSIRTIVSNANSGQTIAYQLYYTLFNDVIGQ